MSDYMFVLESHLDAGQNRTVAEMQRIATEATMNVWLTGGAMRDMLRGALIVDLDFTVERDAVKAGKALVQAMGGKVLAEDTLKRGVELELAGGIRASVSNARIERYSKPGGKPQIEAAPIHADLLRRDFTINAIALSLNRGSRGLLIDPANGQADLTNRELRTANSYAFYDDPSRIFRLIRFQYTLGFEISTRAQSQLENALMEGYQAGAPSSALASEIRALALSPNAVPGLESYDKLGLLKVISGAMTGAKLNAPGLAKFEKVLNGVLPPGTQGGWLAFLTILMEKLTPKERGEVMKAFDLPKAEAEGLKKLEAGAKKLEAALKSARVTKPSHVYDALEHATTDEVLMTLQHSDHRVVQDRIRAFYSKYLPMAQEVTEEQVVATGVKPGTPKYDKAYKALVTQHLNARPRKVVLPEPEALVPPTPPSPPLVAGRGVRK
jgi:tRNA nucleotidyltransferase (CCA-adding enzyme)